MSNFKKINDPSKYHGSVKIKPNHRKVKQTHPDYMGIYVDDNGKKYYVSLWERSYGAEKMFIGRIYGVTEWKNARRTTQNNPPEDNTNIDDMPF